MLCEFALEEVEGVVGRAIARRYSAALYSSKIGQKIAALFLSLNFLGIGRAGASIDLTVNTLQFFCPGFDA